MIIAYIQEIIENFMRDLLLQVLLLYHLSLIQQIL